MHIRWPSEPIPYAPFVYRRQWCDALRKQIGAAFLDDAASSSLHELLDGFNATRFIAVDDGHYIGIRKLLDKPPK